MAREDKALVHHASLDLKNERHAAAGAMTSMVYGGHAADRTR